MDGAMTPARAPAMDWQTEVEVGEVYRTWYRMEKDFVLLDLYTFREFILS